MKLLLLNPKNCNQIAKELESDWWTVQKHLQILMRENIVKNFNIGRRKLYKLTPKGKKALNELQSTQTRGL
jgi:predicted transcriptional regulator